MMQPIKLQYYSPENDYYLLSVQSLLHLQALQYAHRLTAPNLVPRLLVGMEEKEPGIHCLRTHFIFTINLGKLKIYVTLSSTWMHIHISILPILEYVFSGGLLHAYMNSGYHAFFLPAHQELGYEARLYLVSYPDPSST